MSLYMKVYIKKSKQDYIVVNLEIGVMPSPNDFDHNIRNNTV